jgi:hypothetical protein
MIHSSPTDPHNHNSCNLVIVSSEPYSTPASQPSTSADNFLVAPLTQPERHICQDVQPPTQTLQPPPSFDAHYDSHKCTEAAQPPPQRRNRKAPSKAQKADEPPDISGVRPEGGQSADMDGDTSHVEADTSLEDKISGDSKTQVEEFPPFGGVDAWFIQRPRSQLSRRRKTKVKETSFKYRTCN